MEVRNVVNELDTYVPGRSQEEIANEFNVNIEDIIKLGSNENPWGSSPKVVEAIKKELKNINRYPETDVHLLKEELAKYTNLSTDQIIVAGDGADEIIDVLAKTFINPGDEFITPLPTYTYYEFLFKPYGAVPVYGKWDLETNTLNLQSILDNITDKTKMIFLCSPNNPTGALISKEDIKTIAKTATNALIVVDEAYFEYSEVNNVDLLDELSNIFIIRTMSKVMGLAGMRVGYGLSNSEIIEYMHRIKPVFSLTRLSYIAALTTLKDKEYIEESTRKGIESREYLFTELSKFNSLKVFESKSNYIFIDVRNTGMTASEFTRELMKKAVIVRDCTSFKGIDEYWIRISIATLEDDEEFIKRLNSLID